MTTMRTAPVGAWLKISEDLQNVLISHSWVWPIHVYIGTTAPDANSAYHECLAGQPFSMAGIAGQDVYIRSGTDRTLDVTVTAV
ncbi:hypothetical protein [Rhizobium sp. RU36D]|uniref:hypothetical protein n=1 Tax=Rhizobium sp. RU36D TaxID=1907415 RepID=UPI0009D8DAD8|nr:hypothetical protein [Rhizobium sp. RU36D]SMD18035.1 hypothetical protein SAMN05880593_1343 [Rhizobium sp. RU36D]